MRHRFAAVLLVLLSAPAAAEMAEVGDISIRDAWVRASIGSAPNSAAYMVIETSGDQPDQLVGASSPAADQVQMHAHVMDGDIARMRPVEAIEVAPGEPTLLQPGGLHLMLVGLQQRLTAGESMPVTLRFADAGEVTLEIPILPVTAQGPMHHGPSSTH